MEEIKKVEEESKEVQGTEEISEKESSAEAIEEEQTGDNQELDDPGKKELRAEGGTEKLSKVKELSETEKVESLYTGRVVEVPSKKIVFDDKVITVSYRADIDRIAGKTLSEEEIRERLIAALKINADRIIIKPPIGLPKEPQVVKPPIVDPLIDEPTIYGPEEENPDREVEERTTKKFKGKYFIPVLIPLILLMMFQSCIKNNKGPVIEYDKIPLDFILYNIDNPGVLTYNGNQVKAQEGMTSNGIEGNVYDGDYYNYLEQLGIENETSAEAIRVEEIKPAINGYMNILVDENTTQAQKYEAAKKILEIYKTIEHIYLENHPDVEKYAKETIEALEAYPDQNTEAEKKVVDYNLEEFMAELGLTTANVEALEEIVALMDAGYDITIEYERELDEDYVVTGEAVKAVVKDIDPATVKPIWEKISDWINGRSGKGIENNGR